MTLEILRLPYNTDMSPQERQVVMSNNFTFSFVSSSIIIIAFVSLCPVWGCFFILCGLVKQVVSKFCLLYPNIKRAWQNSTCCLIAVLLIRGERHSLSETSHLVSVQIVYSVVI